MNDTPEYGLNPLASAEKAQAIARGLKWLAQAYADSGMMRDATRARQQVVAQPFVLPCAHPTVRSQRPARRSLPACHPQSGAER